MTNDALSLIKINLKFKNNIVKQYLKKMYKLLIQIQLYIFLF